MTGRAQWLAAALGGTALLIIWYQGVFTPLEAARSTERAELATMTGGAERPPTAAELQQRRAQLAQRTTALRASAEPGPKDWLRLLDGVQARSGATLGALNALSAQGADATGATTPPRSSDPRPAADPTVQRYDLAVTGSFDQVTAFGRELEALPVRLQIDGWQLEPAAGERGKAPLVARFRISLFALRVA